MVALTGKSALMKLAVITGVSRGLGKALADFLTEQGFRVVGCSRTSAPPHDVDVSDFARVLSWAAGVEAEHGPPDLLICNAGLTNEPAVLWEIEPESFSRLVDVNLKGVFHVLRAFLPAMVARSQGIVVTLSSDWGRETSAAMAPYCASKFAIEGLTRALAQDLPAGMAAIALHPGTIDTAMLRTVFCDGARYYPTPEAWIKTAGPYLLNLGVEHNGQSLSVPETP